MEQFEALWDLILDRQKQYKQIEEDIAGMTDRKEVIVEAVERAQDQLQALQDKFDLNPPTSPEEIKTMLAEVAHFRETIRQYEIEINRIVKESSSHEETQRSVRLEAASAKKEFDQLKIDYEEESKIKKAELEEQRSKAKALQSAVDPALLEEYNTIKKHISPPVARLVYGQCSGCNTSLPSATLSKIKNGTLVECETCGRMIIQ